MSGIMMSSIASYPKINSGSMLIGTSSSYLSTTVTAPGADACTVEFWYYATSLGGSDNIPFNGWTSGRRDGLLITFFTTGYIFAGPAANLFTNPFSPVLNTWTHIALTVAAGGAGNIYVNGVNRGSPPVNVGSPSTSTSLAIGGRIYTSMLGYISNFRYVKGVEVYTGTFTPPTRPLTATQSAGTNISAITAGQTQLLLNTETAGTYLTDSSSYARTMTPTGTISYSSLNPFS